MGVEGDSLSAGKTVDWREESKEVSTLKMSLSEEKLKLFLGCSRGRVKGLVDGVGAFLEKGSLIFLDEPAETKLAFEEA